ncbi:hypothetical protein G5G95_002656 [Escherichia coli]|uniref:acyltransferase n=1 Tax=Escherichia coli TaxID=562 RepID=UPI0003F1920E|nr:hypothetical protein [Escherichia coli]EEZ5846103.1 hypothetical protein [Escherichia coli]EEZ5855834.1 hypothetical protein [Escherichia coli]EEZ5866268.1 hypothetical protein [Escherichia coli]EEZ5892566.1 hypothetical protein [Escherichia coli]EEZ5929057.1 hypothetical protein [Escherichia coli]
MSTKEKILSFILGFHKTLYLNFSCFSFWTAIKFPVLVAKNVKLVGIGKIILDTEPAFGLIKIGFGDIGIFDGYNSKTLIKNDGTLIFRGKANIGHGTKININNGAKLIFGKDFIISGESSLICSSKIEFGINCLISWDVLIMDTDFHQVYSVLNNGEYSEQGVKEPINIGDDVWIGCRCLIMKGVNIANGCVISAGTKLHKKIVKERTVISGELNKIVRENILWKH